MTEDSIDPKLCSFCEEDAPEPVPSEGRMLIVLLGTQDILFETNFGACLPCGHAYTDTKICEKPEDGRIGVFQFEHHDFLSDETQAQLPLLTEEVKSMVCHVCDVDMGDEGWGDYTPREFAVKMLRMAPMADNLSAICESCASLGLCACCNGYDDE